MESLGGITTNSLPRPELAASKFRRPGPGSRPATAQGVKYDLDKARDSLLPEEWKDTRIAQGQVNVRTRRANRRRKACQDAQVWILDGDDGAELARSNAWLPSDCHRRKPRLEREEAFRIPDMVFMSDVVESDAELYRLGLLYNNEQERGSGFTLDSITHTDPVYEVRPAKQARKGRRSTRLSTGCHDDSSVPCLDLSLGHDFDLAPQILALDFDKSPELFPVEPEQPALYVGPSAMSTPLHVIYECHEDSEPLTQSGPSAEVFANHDCETGGSDMNSEMGDGGGDWGWDMVPLLDRATASIDEASTASEDDGDASIEAWIVLGEN